MNRHIQKTIYVNENGKRKRIECDMRVVLLVKSLWKAGFKTEYSCEGNVADRRVTDFPYITLKECENPDVAEVIIKDYWKCPVMKSKFRNGYAFYALTSKRTVKMWEKHHGDF